MSVPPIPAPLDYLATRPFSFYPAILNIEHNEWRFEKATWSEILVRNTKSDTELWLPRRFMGSISSVDEPVMIVGLNKELEYKAGSVWPTDRKILEMPRAVAAIPIAASPTGPAAKGKHRTPGSGNTSPAEARLWRLILTALALGIAACFIVVILFRGGHGGGRINYTGVMQSDLGFTSEDDYFAVVRKLGTPEEDRWRSETGELQYRLLRFPQHSLFVIFMGVERDKARYIGALDLNWKPIHSVDLPGGRNTAPMLKALPRF